MRKTTPRGHVCVSPVNGLTFRWRLFKLKNIAFTMEFAHRSSSTFTLGTFRSIKSSTLNIHIDWHHQMHSCPFSPLEILIWHARLRCGGNGNAGGDVDGGAIKKAIIRGGGRFKKFPRKNNCVYSGSEVKKSQIMPRWDWKLFYTLFFLLQNQNDCWYN